VVAFAHAASCADNGPGGQAAAEGDEGLFAEAPPYLVDRVFVVEFAVFILVITRMMYSQCSNREDVRVFVERGGERRAVGGSHARHGDDDAEVAEVSRAVRLWMRRVSITVLVLQALSQLQITI
jgi:hypothetical protein